MLFSSHVARGFSSSRRSLFLGFKGAWGFRQREEIEKREMNSVCQNKTVHFYYYYFLINLLFIYLFLFYLWGVPKNGLQHLALTSIGVSTVVLSISLAS